MTLIEEILMLFRLEHVEQAAELVEGSIRRNEVSREDVRRALACFPSTPDWDSWRAAMRAMFACPEAY